MPGGRVASDHGAVSDWLPEAVVFLVTDMHTLAHSWNQLVSVTPLVTTFESLKSWCLQSVCYYLKHGSLISPSNLIPGL